MLLHEAARCILYSLNFGDVMRAKEGDPEQAVSIPLVHIATATGARIRADGLQCVGLLGTRPTMERDFYRSRLAAMGVTALVPDDDGRRYVDRAIYDEMVKNRFLPETRAAFLAIIDDLRSHGAQAVVLGCTEIPLLIRPDVCPLPMYDTTAIHAAAGVEFMIG